MSDQKAINPATSIFGFLSDISIYGVGLFISRILGLVITPILTRLFSIEEFGNLDVVLSGISIVVVVASLYMESTLMRYYHDFNDAKRKVMLFSHLASVSVIGAVLGGLLVVCSFFAAAVLPETLPLGNSLPLAGGIVLSTLAYQHVITVLRTMRRPVHAVSFSFLVAFGQFVLTFVGAVYLDLGINGVLGARFLAEIVISFLYICYFRNLYTAKGTSNNPVLS